MVSRIVLREETLDPAFLPSELPHRDDLVRWARERYDKAFAAGIPHHLLITGSVGSGKTTVARRLAADLVAQGRRQPVPVTQVYVNCWRRSADRVVLLDLLREFGVSLPDRGYSISEMLDVFQQGLSKSRSHVLIILDEVTALLRTGTKLLYTLSRSREVGLGNLSLLLIAPQDVLPLMDPGTRSGFGVTHQVRLPPYDRDALRDILLARADLALAPGALSRATAEQLAEAAAPSGDARLALELLSGAAHHAEERGVQRISAEDVRSAKASIYPSPSDLTLEGLPVHSLLVLLALNRVLASGGSEASTDRVRKTYEAVAEEYGTPARSRVSFWRILKELERYGLVGIRKTGVPGEPAWVGQNEVPVSQLTLVLEERLARKPRQIP